MTGDGPSAPPDIEPAPEVPAGAALVALVPATDDLDRAAAAAWEVARRVANTGRRIALIDCYVDAPRLHTVTGESNEDGIVDVFEYGASLSRIARAQPEGTLFFVPAGTFAPEPLEIMARPRWKRLSAGFRHEDAVMLLFLPPECLGVIATDIDGLVALAPGYPGADAGGSPEIRAALDRGIPLLATYGGTAEVASAPPAPVAPVRVARAPVPPAPVAPPAPVPVDRTPEPTAPAAPAPSAPEWMAPAPRQAKPATVVEEAPGVVAAARPRLTEPPPADAAEPDASSRRPMLRRPLGIEEPRHHLAWFVLALVLAVAAGVVVSRLPLGSNRAATAQPSAAVAPMPPRYRMLVPHAVDTLAFAVQVSAWTSYAQALEDADSIEGRGFLPMVAPVRVGRTLWYRVSVGPVASRAAADSLLRVVRAAGLDGSGAAAVALVPLSFALRRGATPLAARTERTRLRTAGVAAFVLGQADGSYRLFAGAFDKPAAAAYLDSVLTSTGSAGPLGPRVGFRP